jgi:two-component system, OmpR family, sensor histidine kinase ArlS
MMKALRLLLSHIPIKWKMVLWSSFILFVLFAVYNIAQYFAIDHWMSVKERESVQMKMAELQNYFQEKQSALDAEQIRNSQNFLDRFTDNKQFIRILDSQGKIIITVSNQLPSDWVLPQISEQSIQLSIWHGEDHLLVMRSPLITEQFQGTIEIVNNLDTMDNLSDTLLLVMIVAGIGALLLSGLGGLVLAKQLLKPIQAFAETIQNVKERGLQERVTNLNNNDELSNLARHFNDLMDQLETSFKQQKQFVEDASHELRTPISIMKGHLSLLNRWGKSDPKVLDISLEATSQEFQRMEGIVQELLQLTRADSELSSDLIEAVNPSAFVQQTVDRFSVLHPQIAFETELAYLSGIQIDVVPNQMEQVLLILLDNAVKYSSEQHNKVQIVGIQQEEHIQIRVIDFGIGIPEEDLPHVFDRFYRVDKARSRKRGGTGLGLAIAKRLVERNHGEIFISSVEDQGTIVAIKLPFNQNAEKEKEA